MTEPEPQAVQIALMVESLRQAENLYTRLLDMRVTARDARPGLSVGEDQDPLACCRSLLERDGLCLLLLVGVVEPPCTGRVAHIGLRLSYRDLQGVRARAQELACHILTNETTGFLIEDPLGVRWRLIVS